MGWISDFRPRMVAVQSQGCRPVVDAFETGQSDIRFYEDAHTIANGLCVPKPFAGELIMKILYESKGKALAVSDKEISKAVREIGENEGMLVSPEGAATWAATKNLVSENWIQPEEKVLLLNTGSGYKYLDKMS